MMWTSDDILLFVVCRFIAGMSYNDIGYILRAPSSMVTTLALRCGVYSPEEIIRGRGRQMRKGKTMRGETKKTRKPVTARGRSLQPSVYFESDRLYSE